MAIMQVIVDRNKDGSPTDLDQILERLNYETSKASLQFSIRSLILHGLIKKDPEWEKRRGRKRVIIAPTVMGERMIKPRSEKGKVNLTQPEVDFTPVDVPQDSAPSIEEFVE
jgi:hypothetical protein